MKCAFKSTWRLVAFAYVCVFASASFPLYILYVGISIYMSVCAHESVCVCVCVCERERERERESEEGLC